MSYLERAEDARLTPAQRHERALTALTLGHVEWALSSIGCSCTPEIQFRPASRAERRSGLNQKEVAIAIHHESECPAA